MHLWSAIKKQRLQKMLNGSIMVQLVSTSTRRCLMVHKKVTGAIELTDNELELAAGGQPPGRGRGFGQGRGFGRGGGIAINGPFGGGAALGWGASAAVGTGYGAGPNGGVGVGYASGSAGGN
jgi:hypothetical protein